MESTGAASAEACSNASDCSAASASTTVPAVSDSSSSRSRRTRAPSRPNEMTRTPVRTSRPRARCLGKAETPSREGEAALAGGKRLGLAGPPGALDDRRPAGEVRGAARRRRVAARKPGSFP